ncbi:hypothetical protein CICLE_v10029732mg [Citrus x clementina]|uniref:Uncharacterized protein n=1 Tax=Citrus clementina TaxID=85681 RepID=V4SJS6_CITCL|nr:hypothetical protein CICLE_v10029732mg [Citrus x clementina]
MRIGHHSKERITLTPSKVRQPVGQMGKDQKTISQIPCQRQLLTIGSLTDRFSIFPYFSDADKPHGVWVDSHIYQLY